jgi:acyl-CoA thioesterase
VSSEIDDSFSTQLRQLSPRPGTRAEFALDQVEAGRGRALVHLPPSWGQGRSTFGGLQAALLLEAMAALVPQDGPVRRARSLQISFMAPVTGATELEVELLRHGGSATLVRASLHAGGSKQVCTTALGCFAAARESKIEQQPPVRPSLRGPDGLISLPHVEGVTPSFLRWYELRWATGGPPGSGIPDAGFSGWVRAREHVVGVGPAWIAALVDAWPAPALQTPRRMIPASSLNWMLDFPEQDQAAAADEWWTFAVEADRTSEGWSHTHARLWSPNGKLVATSSQLVAVFG